jgi:hypothetical protein
MTGIRAAMVLFASTAIAVAQTTMPCGARVDNSTFFFRDAAGHSRSFCVRERYHVRDDGSHRLRAAIHGARYCKDASVPWQDVNRCRLSATVTCDRRTAKFLFTARFSNCRKVFGRKNFTVRREPLAAVLAPPGLKTSVAGAFLSF